MPPKFVSPHKYRAFVSLIKLDHINPQLSTYLSIQVTSAQHVPIVCLIGQSACRQTFTPTVFMVQVGPAAYVWMPENARQITQWTQSIVAPHQSITVRHWYIILHEYEQPWCCVMVILIPAGSEQSKVYSQPATRKRKGWAKVCSTTSRNKTTPTQSQMILTRSFVDHNNHPVTIIYWIGIPREIRF